MRQRCIVSGFFFFFFFGVHDGGEAQQLLQLLVNDWRPTWM